MFAAEPVRESSSARSVSAVGLFQSLFAAVFAADAPEGPATVKLMDENTRYESECIRIFLAHVVLDSGCCFCGNKSVHAGRGAIEQIALAIVDDDKPYPTFEECADILSFLSNVEPLSKAVCYAHNGDENTVGLNAILHFVRDRIRDNCKKGARK